MRDTPGGIVITGADMKSAAVVPPTAAGRLRLVERAKKKTGRVAGAGCSPSA